MVDDPHISTQLVCVWCCLGELFGKEERERLTITPCVSSNRPLALIQTNCCCLVLISCFSVLLYSFVNEINNYNKWWVMMLSHAISCLRDRLVCTFVLHARNLLLISCIYLSHDILLIFKADERKNVIVNKKITVRTNILAPKRYKII